MDARFHCDLLGAFERRLEADYGVDIVLSVNAVETLLQQAREFLTAATTYLKRSEP